VTHTHTHTQTHTHSTNINTQYACLGDCEYEFEVLPYPRSLAFYKLLILCTKYSTQGAKNASLLSSTLNFASGPSAGKVKWSSGDNMLEDMMYSVSVLHVRACV